MNLERKTNLEKLATVVELIAENGSGRFRGQKLLFLGRSYPRKNLLAIFEDQFDGILTIVRTEFTYSQELLIFERLKALIVNPRPLSEKKGLLPSTLPFSDQRVKNFTNFEPVSADNLEVYSPINAQFIRRLPLYVESSPEGWTHSVPFSEN